MPNAARLCEACAREWTGSPDCPTCGHVTPLVVCAWHESELVTRMAVASGHDVTHGICDACIARGF